MASDTVIELQRPASVSSSISAALEVAFQDLSYYVPARGDDGSKIHKMVLNTISGVIKPGTICAILGPSGGGKTTLLNALAGRTDPARTSGKVYVDGKPRSKCSTYGTFRFTKEESGYVVQEDLLSGTLTVRENFMFSAELRLPASMSKENKRKRVEEVIEILGLQKCANQKIGTELIRGVSGGERRRAMIGMELVISPRVIFLDEPTTGLDASTAAQVMKSLVKLARTGHTIIMSIHQPRYRIFKEFDQLLVLAEGRAVYSGPAKEVVNYFGDTLGYECEMHNNPPDFILDVALRQVKPSRSTAADIGNAEKLPEDDHDSDLGSDADRKDDSAKSPDTKEGSMKRTSSSADVRSRGLRELRRTQQHQNRLADVFTSSKYAKDAQAHLQDIALALANSHGENHRDTRDKDNHHQRNLLTEYRALAARTAKSVYRNPAVSVLQVFALMLFAIFIGIVFLDSPTTQSGIVDRVGVSFFLVMNMVFSNLSAIELILKEKPMFLHEKASGYYSTLPYFLCKIMYDIIPLRIFPVLPFAAISYFMMGWQSDAAKFFQYCLTLSMTSITSASLCYFISSMVNVYAIANLLTAVSYVIFMLFGGLLVSSENVPGVFRWIRHISVFGYPYENLVSNELSGLTFHCTDDELNDNGVCPIEEGNEYLRLNSLSVNDYWQNIGCLAAMSVAYFTMTYVRLRTLKPRTA